MCHANRWKKSYFKGDFMYCSIPWLELGIGNYGLSDHFENSTREPGSQEPN